MMQTESTCSFGVPMESGCCIGLEQQQRRDGVTIDYLVANEHGQPIHHHDHR